MRYLALDWREGGMVRVGGFVFNKRRKVVEFCGVHSKFGKMLVVSVMS